jgi:Ca2+/Na+ antiporter
VVHGPADMGFMDWQNTTLVMFFFLFFSPFLALYYWTIFSIFIFLYFLFLYITKALPCLTPYRLKDKKGVYRLETPCRLKNYDRNINSEENTTKEMT